MSRIDNALVREVARAVNADPKTVVRRLAGLPVRGAAGVAIDQELARRGLVVLDGADVSANFGNVLPRVSRIA